jgi:hypothetical protein
MKILALLSMVSPSSGPEWQSQTPQPGRSQIMRQASIFLCSHILAAFRGVNVFRLTDHSKVIGEVEAELKLCNAKKSESSLNNLASKMSCNNRRTILRGKETGQWLSLLPSTINNTELSAQEFREVLLLWYACCLLPTESSNPVQQLPAEV